MESPDNQSVSDTLPVGKFALKDEAKTFGITYGGRRMLFSDRVQATRGMVEAAVQQHRLGADIFATPPAGMKAEKEEGGEGCIIIWVTPNGKGERADVPKEEAKPTPSPSPSSETAKESAEPTPPPVAKVEEEEPVKVLTVPPAKRKRGRGRPRRHET